MSLRIPPIRRSPVLAGAMLLGAVFFLGGCGDGLLAVPTAPNEWHQGAAAPLVVHNAAAEIICYVHVAPENQPRSRWRRRDRLEPDELALENETRRFELPDGTYRVQLLDCNRDMMLDAPNVPIGPQGMTLWFRHRE